MLELRSLLLFREVMLLQTLWKPMLKEEKGANLWSDGDLSVHDLSPESDSVDRVSRTVMFCSEAKHHATSSLLKANGYVFLNQHLHEAEL